MPTIGEAPISATSEAAVIRHGVSAPIGVVGIECETLGVLSNLTVNRSAVEAVPSVKGVWPIPHTVRRPSSVCAAGASVPAF